jgi:hypothetical protein
MEMLTVTEDPTAALTTYRLMDRYAFTVPRLDPELATIEPVLHFNIALRAAVAFARDSAVVLADQTLSPFGLAQKLDPLRQDVIEIFARCSRNIDVFETIVMDDEARLVLVPPLKAGDVVGALDDREIRDYWRAADIGERGNMLTRIEEGAPGADRFALAILRSPVPLDALVDAMKLIWAQAQRNAYPEQAAAIENGKVVIEWGRRALAHLAGVLPAMPAIERERIESFVLGSNDPAVHAGARVFGLDPDHIARLRLRMTLHKKAA